MPGEQLKKNFLRDVKNTVAPTHLVLAVKVPSGATELISNSQMLAEKIAYITEVYDDNFVQKANPAVRIIGYMLV